MDNIEIEQDDAGLNVEIDKPKEKKKRDSPKYSGYVFTFNTNKPFFDKTDSELAVLDNKLTKAVLSVLNKINIKNLIEVEDPSKIIEFRMFSGSELGENNKFLHMHVFVSISHRTKVKLDISKIYEDVKQAYSSMTDGANLYPNYKLYRKKLKSLDEIMYEYLRKGQKLW